MCCVFANPHCKEGSWENTLCLLCTIPSTMRQVLEGGEEGYPMKDTRVYKRKK